MVNRSKRDMAEFLSPEGCGLDPLVYSHDVPSVSVRHITKRGGSSQHDEWGYGRGECEGGGRVSNREEGNMTRQEMKGMDDGGDWKI